MQSNGFGKLNCKPARLVVLSVVLVCCASILASSQTNSAYKVGTVMSVSLHDNSKAKDPSLRQYDLGIKVEGTIYQVLFTPLNNDSTLVEYKVGFDLPVLVQGKTMKFHDSTGREFVVPILSSKQLEAKK